MSGCRTVRVALAGCGAVGGELARALRAGESWIAAQHGVRPLLTRVLVRDGARARGVALPAGVLTTELGDFLAADADVFVEAIGDVDTAAAIAQAASSRRVPFVTANKALIAARGDALARAGTALWFEAAVAGGVPVVRVLRDYLRGGAVRRVRGVLNGTCNYVLTRIERGAGFGEALDEARRRGFAEADCARDLDGRDAADKIAILAWLAFGTPPSAVPVAVRGILPDPERLVRGAAAAGGRLRLIAECACDGVGVAARVEPVVVAPESPFARTLDEENRVAIDTGWPWPLELAGPGAGGAPTAAALLADLLQATSHVGAGAPGTLPARFTRASVPAQPIARSAEPPRSYLVGVHGASGRAARVCLAQAGIASEVVGASAGDAWLVTAPVRANLLEGMLASLPCAAPVTVPIGDQPAARANLRTTPTDEFLLQAGAA